MSRKQKLELTWIGKDQRPKLEPRILLEDDTKTYHAQHRVTENDIFDNKLIFGDNLLALKALEQEYAGKVKCVFIDPPYNTGSAFEHYDDGIEHSIWLGLMRDRLEILRNLMSEDGSLWITIDDNEAHYLKVMCDEIFGRKNFIGAVAWEKSDSPRMDAVYFSYRHDNVFAYAKNIQSVLFKKLPLDEVPGHYNRTDEQGRLYYTKPLRAMGGQGETREARPTLYYPIMAPDGTEVYPKMQDGKDGAWRWNKEKVEAEKNRIDWVNGKNGWVPYYRIYADNIEGRPAETIWFHSEVGTNRTSKAEIKSLNLAEKAFDTPKPEGLIKRILDISSNAGDLVLDSFAGSGTTGAVAHKMGRRWIMVELGDHCHTHIVPRLQKVIDGVDKGGVTEAVGWKGGGGFRYYSLAPSLVTFDKYNQPVINKEYNPVMLSQAMCKLMGFTYAPSDTMYWQQGHSTETDFIYVTTQTLDQAQLAAISEEVGEGRTLLICCAAFRGDVNKFENLTVKKIPRAVLDKCEWNKDDYSLNVQNLPMLEVDPATDIPTVRAKRAAKQAAGDLPLFDSAPAVKDKAPQKKRK